MVTGLQNLINSANNYFTEHVYGLLFYATKTSCVTFRKCSLEGPSWYISGTELPVNENLDDLGAILSKNGHHQKIMNSTSQVVYGLQGSILCNNDVSLEVVFKSWKSMIQPVRLYATQSVGIINTDLKDMDKTQAKLVKSALSLVKYCRGTLTTDECYVYCIIIIWLGVH